MPSIPAPFHAWYRAAYPTLTFNPEWLDACVDYLQDTDPAGCTTPGLIKAVEVQLLSSDLSTSVRVPGPTDRRAALTTRTPASARTVLFSGGKRAAVLFQVQRVTDAAHSALQGREVLEEKREARKLAEKYASARTMRLDEDEPHEDGSNRDAVLPPDKAPVFPRGNSAFVLSDGETEVKAFERERIDGLGLEEIKLGTKLLIHDVPFVNGIMMLTRQNTIVKGYQVEELEAIKEWLLENGFRERLGMDPLPLPGDAADSGVAQQDSNVPEPNNGTRQAQPTAARAERTKLSSPSPDFFGEEVDLIMDDAVDADEEEALRAIEEEALLKAQVRARVRERRSQSARTVKAELPSSAGRPPVPSSGPDARSGLSGQVDVLELDSDEEVPVGQPEYPAKKRRQLRDGVVPGRRIDRATVLELDSDD